MKIKDIPEPIKTRVKEIVTANFKPDLSEDEYLSNAFNMVRSVLTIFDIAPVA